MSQSYSRMKWMDKGQIINSVCQILIWILYFMINVISFTMVMFLNKPFYCDHFYEYLKNLFQTKIREEKMPKSGTHIFFREDFKKNK